jgi:hypothetical protein
MYRTGILLFSLFAFSLSGFALPGHPYLGGALDLHGRLEFLPVYPGMYDTRSSNTIKGYGGYAVDAEYGRIFHFWSLFVGFRPSISPYRQTGMHYVDDGRSVGANGGHQKYDWQTYRFYTGARVWAFEHDPNPIKPLFGAGLSFGWAHRSFTIHETTATNGIMRESQTSPGTLGWFVEPGIMVKINPRWRALLVARIENLGLQFKDSPAGLLHEVSHVSMASVQLGFSREFGVIFL